MTVRGSLFVGLLATVLSVCVPALASAEIVKARVLDVNDRKSEVTVDVAGQTRTYRVNDRSLYRVLRDGRLVVITAERVGGRHTIVDAQQASQQGRVMRIDDRRGAASIQDSDTRTTDTYYFDAGSDLRRLREGDVITFEAEERGPRRVITQWRPAGGGGGWGGSSGSGGSGWGGSGGSGGSGWGGGGGNLDIVRDSGRILDVDRRRTQLTILLSSNGRRQTFDVSDRRLMQGLKVEDTIRFSYEPRRGDRPVIVDLR